MTYRPGIVQIAIHGQNDEKIIVHGEGAGTGSAQAISVTTGGDFHTVACGISYTGVTAVTDAATVAGESSAGPSQTVSCGPRQTILQLLANQGFADMTATSGGTSRLLKVGPAGRQALAIREATATTTFTATLSGLDRWGALALILS
ncbi:hypothetical protein [Mycolicibacterium sp. XJ1904]